MDSVAIHPLSRENPPLNRSDLHQIPLASSDPGIPLFNLSILDRRIDFLRRFLSKSLETHASISGEQIELVSKEIASTIQQIILNGASLISSSQQHAPDLTGRTVPVAEYASELMDLKPQTVSPLPRKVNDSIKGKAPKPSDLQDRSRKSPNLAHLELPTCSRIPLTLRNPAHLRIPAAEENIVDLKLPFCSDSRNPKIPADQGIPAAGDGDVVDVKLPTKSTTSRKLKNLTHGDGKEDDVDDGYTEIIELDSVELLAEHIHFCEICGKGFKRDANLRMHKRAHGNRFKTLEALSKPDRCDEDRGRKIRFSCPFAGCNRNQSHKRFRPLKSAICVKNHFKRSHCPKMYSCDRCNKKSFSVVSDLKSHLKHCGECRWRCSCGTSFSRKDKLFGHVALFEGHMPAVVGEEKSKGADWEEEMQVDEEEHIETADAEVSDGGFFEGLLEGFGTIDGGSFDDVLGFL